MNVIGSGRSIIKLAGRIAITGLANIVEQLVIAGTPVKAKGLFQFFAWTIGCARSAAFRIINNAPGMEAIVALFRIKNAIPIEQHRKSLRQDIRVEAAVSYCGIEPDFAPGAFRG